MTTLLTRRRTLAASALAAAAGATASCRGPRAGREQATVSIVPAAGYGQHLFETVRRLLAAHKVNVRGLKVVLKPNLVEFDAEAPINTHPLVVHAALEAFRAAGAADVRIAEGPGHRRVTLDLADSAGYFGIIPRFEELFADLNLDDVSRVSIQRPVSKLHSVYLPNTILGCDLLVSLPKLKTHHWVGATLSMKNLFGMVPGGVYGWPKNVLHWAGINECIADIYRLAPRSFAIVDGVDGMEGNGPIQGTRKRAGVLVAGGDLPSVDATCCRIMGLDPAKVPYLGIAVPPGRLAESAIRQLADPVGSHRTPFALLKQFESWRLSGA